MIYRITLLLLWLLSLNAYADWTALIKETGETVSMYDATDQSLKDKTVTYRKMSDDTVHTAKIVSFDEKTNTVIVRTKDGKLLTISISDC